MLQIFVFWGIPRLHSRILFLNIKRNKSDLASERQVTREEAESLALEMGCSYVEMRYDKVRVCSNLIHS